MASHVPAKHLNTARENIWHEVHLYSMTGNRSNLGHGSPEEGIHDGVLRALQEISSDPDKYVSLHQYTLLTGHPRLLKALSEFYSPLYNKKLDVKNEILVTSGASFALYCAITGLLNPGDEVIIIEPFYEQYPFIVDQARGKSVYIPLRPKCRDGACNSEDWVLDPEELESKFNSKTKIIVLNNPHNPLGKVFSRSELEMIGNLAKKYDVVVLVDEVYEFLVYEGHEHVRMATLPGMWERTITIGSAGKLFSITGWRVGWAIAPPNLINCLFLVHQDSMRTVQTNLQDAIATGLELERPLMMNGSSYWSRLREGLLVKRDRLISFLSSVGLDPITPQGTYFVVANITTLASKVELNEPGETTDYKFFRWLSKSKNLICVPMSAFYSKEHKHLGENIVRFCFIKKESTLKKAEEILTGIKEEYF